MSRYDSEQYFVEGNFTNYTVKAHDDTTQHTAPPTQGMIHCDITVVTHSSFFSLQEMRWADIPYPPHLHPLVSLDISSLKGN